MVPTIGNEIAWIDIVQMAFRVTDFDRNDTKITSDGNVEAASPTQPYGYLLVESPTLNQPAALPIIHRDDFLLADSVFGDPDVYSFIENGKRELLVTYAPKKMNEKGYSMSPHHVLHYTLTSSGTMDSYYADTPKGNERMAAPEPHLLFGPFTYDGEIRVQLNLDPEL